MHATEPTLPQETPVPVEEPRAIRGRRRHALWLALTYVGLILLMARTYA